MHAVRRKLELLQTELAARFVFSSQLHARHVVKQFHQRNHHTALAVDSEDPVQIGDAVRSVACLLLDLDWHDVRTDDVQLEFGGRVNNANVRR